MALSPSLHCSLNSRNAGLRSPVFLRSRVSLFVNNVNIDFCKDGITCVF